MAPRRAACPTSHSSPANSKTAMPSTSNNLWRPTPKRRERKSTGGTGRGRARLHHDEDVSYQPSAFGVRQLAAAFRPASLLAGISAGGIIPCQQAGSSQSGSKLPHSKFPSGEGRDRVLADS